MLTQTAIRRALELNDAMIRDANAFSYTPVWVNSRSLFELASLMFDTVDKVGEIVAKWDFDRYKEFDLHLSEIMLGFKSAAWHPGREKGEHLDLVPQNIVTIIQRIEKKHIPEYFSLYELLSEVAHPNYMGHDGALSGAPSGGSRRGILRPAHRARRGDTDPAGQRGRIARDAREGNRIVRGNAYEVRVVVR